MELDARLGPIEGEARRVLDDLDDRQAVVRMVGRDHTLWQDDPTEVADRLGWLDCPTSMREHIPRLRQMADECGADGLERVVVLGMGGSSLFPEVLARTFGSRPHRLQITVLDTTHPAAVARVTADWPAARTLFLAASKSGTTIETRSHLEHFWAEHPDPACFAATTDPGSALGALAADRGFRATFENPPDIGGRYSALSLFGLVPAALGGVSLDGLLDGGALALDVDLGAAEQLAAAMAAGVAAGRDKLTFVLDHRIGSFGLWVEQLIAESTGKDERGLVPAPGEDPRGGPDRQGARVHVRNDYDLGAEFFRWEFATAVAGAVLGINPFDQPHVQAAKDRATAVLEGGETALNEEGSLDELLAQRRDGDYLAIQAFVDPAREEELGVLAERGRALGLVVTVGLGPRYLHSTGQLHKGGANNVLCLQVVDDHGEELAIPGREFGFRRLIAAQAAGDYEALRERGRRVARIAI